MVLLRIAPLEAVVELDLQQQRDVVEVVEAQEVGLEEAVVVEVQQADLRGVAQPLVVVRTVERHHCRPQLR